MPAAYHVDVVPFGQPETGLWCDRCMLPSWIRITYAYVQGMRVLGWGRIDGCVECGAGPNPPI